MKYDLVGVDGNAFALIGYTQKAMRECGYSKEEIGTVTKDAMAGGYNNLIVVLDEAIQNCNTRRVK